MAEGSISPVSAGKLENTPPGDAPLSGSQLSQFFNRLDDITDSTFIPVDVSPGYHQRLDRIMARLWLNGHDINRIGRVEVGYHQLFPVHATVNVSNMMAIGTAAGLEDWMLELVLAHEFRHLWQNDQAWRRICVDKGVAPDAYPLLTAMADQEIRPEYAAVAETYLQWRVFDDRIPFLELDAYNFTYEYFTKFVEPSCDTGQRFAFLKFLSDRYAPYLKSAAARENLLFEPENLGIISLANENYQSLLDRQQTLENPEAALQAADEMAQSMSAYFERSAGHLTHENGESYSLRERLIHLQGTISQMDEDTHFIGQIGLMHQAGVGEQTILPAAQKGSEQTMELNSLLNRQVAGYYFRPVEGTPHRVTYRNDDAHTPDGAIRLQYFGELDFGGNEEIRVGEDLGGYVRFGEKAFLKIAPLLYLGFRPADTNVSFGPRLDLELHYDIDITQRAGISLVAGANAGAHLGTSEHEAYYTLYLGAEVFRF
ncbi:MAG: hypothetical protein Q7T11_02695 [Deltaproteobacteria bacterium]|nr:hypothetical protein [Deltaproteobacteria bacterium]